MLLYTQTAKALVLMTLTLGLTQGQERHEQRVSLGEPWRGNIRIEKPILYALKVDVPQDVRTHKPVVRPNGGLGRGLANIAEKILLDGPDHKVDWARYFYESGAHAGAHYLDISSTRDFRDAGWCEGNKLFRNPDGCTPNLQRIWGVKMALLIGIQVGKYPLVRRVPRTQRIFTIFSVIYSVKVTRTALNNWKGLGVYQAPYPPATLVRGR